MDIEYPSPTMARTLAIEAVRDAIHFVNTRPVEEIDMNHLIDAGAHLYNAVGLPRDEAMVLFRESIARHSERCQAIMQEARSAG